MFRNAGREANANPNVPWMAVVRASFAGYTTDGDPIFVFVYPATTQDNYLPPHDHSSNNPADGRFAFACFAPGTAVPSLPWAL